MEGRVPKSQTTWTRSGMGAHWTCADFLVAVAGLKGVETVCSGDYFQRRGKFVVLLPGFGLVRISFVSMC
jgi:hypothetical protein